MWIPFLIEVYVPVKQKQLLILTCFSVYEQMLDDFFLYTDLFKISTNSVTGPLLPRVALAIC